MYFAIKYFKIRPSSFHINGCISFAYQCLFCYSKDSLQFCIICAQATVTLHQSVPNQIHTQPQMFHIFHFSLSISVYRYSMYYERMLYNLNNFQIGKYILFMYLFHCIFDIKLYHDLRYRTIYLLCTNFSRYTMNLNANNTQ